jgi:hypothetical protein
MLINKFTKIFLSLLALLVFTHFAFAELNATWYTKSLDVQVGDTVKIDLYINPSIDHPVVTVSNTLNYDKNKLKFSDSYFPDGWIVVTKEPNYITDEVNGFLRRTAGFPNGVRTNSKYMTYEFTATEVGQAGISIEDGMVLDQESEDLGFQKKRMVINITPKIEVATTIATDKVVPLVIAPIVNTVHLNMYGKTAIREGEDYAFVVFRDMESNKDKASTVEVAVIDMDGKNIYSTQKYFEATGPQQLEFTVPFIVFTPGTFPSNSTSESLYLG